MRKSNSPRPLSNIDERPSLFLRLECIHTKAVCPVQGENQPNIQLHISKESLPLGVASIKSRLRPLTRRQNREEVRAIFRVQGLWLLKKI